MLPLRKVMTVGGAETVRTRGKLGLLRHEVVSEMRVGPSESACRRRLQTASSCCARKGRVVSVEEKASRRAQVRTKKVSAERTTGSVGTFSRWGRKWGLSPAPRAAEGGPAYCLGDTRRTGGTSLVWALAQNVGTRPGMARENPISGAHERGK
jgi:hypothetical protein